VGPACNNRSVQKGGWVSNTRYELGHEPDELERLTVQGRALAAPTRALLEAAGLRDGMRVLDLGSGVGDASFVVADIVGDAGEVVGIDRAPEAVAEATARAERLGRANVRFVLRDIHDPVEDGAFDAAVCRLVLMFVPDPSAVLRTQAAAVRPGGIVAPIEPDISRAGTIPQTPLASQAVGWVTAAYEQSGTEIALGPRLWQVLEQAGLTPTGMLTMQPYFGPADPMSHALLPGIVRTLLPVLERTGVAAAGEVDIETLQGRLREDMEAAHAVFGYPALTCAWAVV
jgi:ubiquinone/menaquinone biosynthesis C-methylase UbiE